MTLLNFDLRHLSAKVEQTTWVMKVGVSLSSLAVEDHHAPATPISGGTMPPRMLLETGGIRGSEDFLDFTYEKVRRLRGVAWRCGFILEA